MSTVMRQRAGRASAPHTAVARERAGLVRRGRRLLRATEELLGTGPGLAFEDADKLDVPGRRLKRG